MTITATKKAARNSGVFKPMLSGKLTDIAHAKFPLLVSPKLDGIRCIIKDGTPISRNLKVIPNKFIRAQLANLPDGLDGELVVGDPTASDVWNHTNSGVMSVEGEPDFIFHVFDMVDFDNPSEPFFTRYQNARSFCGKELSQRDTRVHVVPQHETHDVAGLDYLEEFYVSAGYEGVMCRDPRGPYKFGRATEKEGSLLKLKRWHDDEANVISLVERMHNANVATVDALGRTKRSSHQENKVGRNDLGALVCSYNGNTFEVGTGFTDKERAAIWANPAKYIGARVTFRYQMLTQDGIPRFPVFLRWRNDL